MSKVRCKVCANEVSGMCSIKKTKVKVSKSRTCEAYIYDEGKVKSKQKVNTIHVGYKQMQENKKRMKAELKAIKEMMKKGQANGTAQDLGLLPQEESRIIKPGDPNFTMPNSSLTSKHPLTGDLSRFTTTASED